jgi:hypothetical protein
LQTLCRQDACVPDFISYSKLTLIYSLPNSIIHRDGQPAISLYILFGTRYEFSRLFEDFPLLFGEFGSEQSRITRSFERIFATINSGAFALKSKTLVLG